jgi:hypothetical protein
MKGAIIAGVIALAAGSAGGFFIGRDAGFRDGEQSGDRDALNKKINRAEQLAREMEAARDELDRRVKDRDDQLKKWSEKDLAKEAEKAKGEAAAAKSEADGLKAAKTQLENENQALKAKEAEAAQLRPQLEEAKTKLAAAQAELAKVPTAEVPLTAITFGRAGSIEEIANADWRGMGKGLHDMKGDVPKLYQKMLSYNSREDMNKDAEFGQMQTGLAERMGKITGYAGKLVKKLPTHDDVMGGINGAYAHPAVIGNLIAATLDAAGKPLTEAQRQSFADVGAQYEKDYDAAQAPYTDETYALQKLLDEAVLKKRARDQMLAVLTPEQQAELTPPAMRDVLQIDMYSPVFLIQGHAQAVTRASREKLVEAFKYHLQEQSGANADAMAGADTIAADFIGELQSQLTPTTLFAAMLYRLDDAVAAGQAQLKAYQKLATLLKQDGDGAKKLRSSLNIFIPRIVPEPKKEG